MLNSRRIFVDAVKKYCARHGIAIELRSEGWLIVMHRGPRRHFAFGYDIGLNSAVAHRIANDGDIDVVFIEVQRGSYFGEDDIVRLEDDYGRAGDEAASGTR